MLPRASELNLLSKSESFASSKTLNRFFFTTSFSNSACSSPPNPSLMMAFKIVLRVSFDDRLLDPLLFSSPVAPQKATAPCRTTGSTSFSFHRKERSRLLFDLYSCCLRARFSPTSFSLLSSISPLLCLSIVISSSHAFRACLPKSVSLMLSFNMLCRDALLACRPAMVNSASANLASTSLRSVSLFFNIRLSRSICECGGILTTRP